MALFKSLKARIGGLFILLVTLYVGSTLAQGTAASVTGSFSGLVFNRTTNTFNSTAPGGCHAPVTVSPCDRDPMRHRTSSAGSDRGVHRLLGRWPFFQVSERCWHYHLPLPLSYR
jgi:hypothetical protein